LLNNIELFRLCGRNFSVALTLSPFEKLLIR
jgi:hypothetical protein